MAETDLLARRRPRPEIPHAPGAHPFLLDIRYVHTKLPPRIKEDADCEVGVPHTLSIAADTSAKLAKGIAEIIVDKPLNLSENISGLRLRRPRLDSSDVSLSNKGLHLVSARYDEAGNLG